VATVIMQGKVVPGTCLERAAAKSVGVRDVPLTDGPEKVDEGVMEAAEARPGIAVEATVEVAEVARTAELSVYKLEWQAGKLAAEVAATATPEGA
jgi:hypothetical protein